MLFLILHSVSMPGIGDTEFARFFSDLFPTFQTIVMGAKQKPIKCKIQLTEILHPSKAHCFDPIILYGRRSNYIPCGKEVFLKTRPGWKIATCHNLEEYLDFIAETKKEIIALHLDHDKEDDRPIRHFAFQQLQAEQGDI